MDRWLFLLSGIWSHLWMCAYERGLAERGPNKYIRPETTLELAGFVYLSEKKRNTKKMFPGLDFLRGVEWRVDLCAPVHDSGMIKDLYCILILLLCCQQPFPVPNTHTQVCKLMQLCTTRQWERKMGSQSPVTEKQNASFPFVWNGAVAQSKPRSRDGSFREQWGRVATWSVIIHRQCKYSVLCYCYEENGFRTS